MKKKAYVRNDGTLSYKQEIRIHGKRITKRFSRIADAERWYSEMKRQKELAERGLININHSELTLGHSSPMMTQRYAHLAPGYLEKKAGIVRISKGAPNVSVIRLA